MSAKAILVTGGTGKTGSAIAEILTERGFPVRIASRSAHGKNGVRFDWRDECTFPAALAGVGAVYLVAPALVVDPLPMMSVFIYQALTAGVRRFVLLSASSLPEGGPAMGRVHRFLREVAPEWAVLQPTWFMENFSSGHHLPTIRDDGVIITATGEGRVPFVAVDDIAQVAVRALIDEVPHNAAHRITGPESLSYEQAAEIIALAAGRPVRHERITVDQLTERWVALGLGRPYASMLASMDGAISAGAEDHVARTVEELTGSAAQSLSEFAVKHGQVWRMRSEPG